MKILKNVLSFLFIFTFSSMTLSQKVNFETAKLDELYALVMKKDHNVKFLNEKLAELKLMKKQESICIKIENNNAKNLLNFYQFVSKNNITKYLVAKPALEKKYQSFLEQKNACQLRLYEINYLLIEYQKEINRLLEKSVITVNKSFWKIVQEPMMFPERFYWKSLAESFSFTNYSHYEYNLIVTIFFFSIIIGFAVRYSLGRFLLRKSISPKTRILVSNFKQYCVPFAVCFCLYFWIMASTLNFNHIGSFEQLFKIIFEILVIKYIYDLYFFLHIKSEILQTKLRQALNYLWIFFGLNSVVEILFNNSIIYNTESQFALKIYTLCSSLVLFLLFGKLIFIATSPQYYKEQKKPKLLTIRKFSYIALGIVIFAGLLLSWGFGLDYVDLEIYKKLVLLIALGLLFKATKDVLTKIENDFQENRFPKAIKIKHLLGETYKKEKIREITGLRIALTTYIVFFVFIPLGISFFELSKTLVIIWIDFCFKGIMIGPMSLKPIALLNAIFVYLSLILLSRYFIEKIIQNPVFINNPDRKVIMMMTLKYLSQFISIIIALGFYGFNFSHLSIILGGLSVGVGIGMNVFLGDMISGIMILFGKYLHINDYISISDKNNFIKGHIQKINLMFTQILTDDYNVLYIANSKIIGNPLVNHTAYGANPSCNIMLSLKRPEQESQAQELCLKVLLSNTNVVTSKTLAPHVYFEQFIDDNKKEKNMLFLTFNLHEFQNKKNQINEIRGMLEKELKKHRIFLAVN